jgi:hypothetical protein
MFNGEYCAIHFCDPCDCDFLERHGIVCLANRLINWHPNFDVKTASTNSHPFPGETDSG